MDDLSQGLTPDAVWSTCASIGMSKGPAGALQADAVLIAASPRLAALALRCARLVFAADLPAKEAVARWPEVGHGPNLPPHFDAVVLLAGYGRLEAEHRLRGIAREVTCATLRDLELWMDHHLALHGRPGFSETAWFARLMTGRVLQLGRLQFEPHPLDLPFVVFRHRAGCAAAILVEGGWLLRADGQFADADGDAEGATRPGTWRSRFVDDEAGWHGSPAAAAGIVDRCVLDLARADWDLLARRGDPALAVHIPATGAVNGPLEPAACAESLRRAIPFFDRYLPEARPRLLTCASWMLDPQLARFLAPETNLARFQRSFRLVPVPGADDRQTLERVFGGPVADWTTAPRDTSLQRVVAGQAAAGRKWRMGGGLRMPADHATDLSGR